MDRPEIYLRSLDHAQEKWTLGFKSQASPHETMTDVLKVFHSLNVQWKKIGHYNMKCLWMPSLPNDFKATLDDGFTKIRHISGPEHSIKGARTGTKSNDAVKFEIQLYKAPGELHVLDLQRIHGPPFLFLEICAAFFALVVA
ncbi:unnamed protein product [Ilex paraguariensis]